MCLQNSHKELYSGYVPGCYLTIFHTYIEEASVYLQSTELKLMEEHESFLVGIKFLLNIWCMSLQMKTQQTKGTSFIFYLMFSLILSCLICSEASSVQEKLLQTQ